MAATLALDRSALLRAGGHPRAEGDAEPPDDLPGPADVDRPSRGQQDVADRHARPAGWLPLPSGGARPRASLGHSTVARLERRVRPSARLLPDEPARRSSGSVGCGRDRPRARPLRDLRRPGRRERERLRCPVGGHHRPHRGAVRRVAGVRQPRPVEEGGGLRHGRRGPVRAFLVARDADAGLPARGRGHDAVPLAALRPCRDRPRRVRHPAGVPRRGSTSGRGGHRLGGEPGRRCADRSPPARRASQPARMARRRGPDRPGTDLRRRGRHLPRPRDRRIQIRPWT